MLGLDPLATEKSAYDDVLEGIRNLSKAMIDPTRKTPIIVCPNGFISDGGLAFLMGQYVLATPHSSLRFDQPTRGLSFDPTGASYVLNRVGYDFEQIPAKKYASTIAKILALTGFEADANDMVSTGLATHFVENLHNIFVLETALAEILPYQDQGLLPKSTRSQGQWLKEKYAYLESGGVIPEDIPNRRFRNMGVHNLMDETFGYYFRRCHGK